MLRRGYLRSKARGKDPLGNLYAREVRERRKVENQPAYSHDPHHVCPPHRSKLLFFILIPRTFHRYIEDNKRWARENGWLANINGSFSIAQPIVERARERYVILMRELEEKQL